MPETTHPPRRILELTTYVETDEIDATKNLILQVMKPVGSGKPIYTATVQVGVPTERGNVMTQTQIVLQANSIPDAFKKLAEAIPEISKKVVEDLMKPKLAMPGDGPGIPRMPPPNGLSMFRG